MIWPASRRRIRELVAEYYEPLYRYAYRLTGQPDVAEDLVQETFCRAQMQWRQLRNQEQPRPWLFAILRNGFLRKVRDERTSRQIPLQDVGELCIAPESPESEIEPSVLQEALQSVPEPYRTPLILFYFEEFTYKEIAEHMGAPIGTVMSRLARGKLYLRQKLAPTLNDAVAGEARGL